VSKPHAQETVVFNIATPFSNPCLFGDMGNEHYSLCIADDEGLRLGVIDDIHKLHVTTFPLGMAPRRIVHCPEGRLFAVDCIESGIIPSIKKKTFGSGYYKAVIEHCGIFLPKGNPERRPLIPLVEKFHGV
jgi:hypothetical protein